ncbi:hypothetical protein [Heyndrickxia sporothermodurans]|uniref:hypothetical protein n=1 Tax=Heyndrickxia sporothermodurans TaxID=46224 RepID=UPI002E1D437D|nr:hypothetical protein [Heyndrickxia sporothermodurans]MED3697411.1 hypothetical protein [Heyndrickxia sporothermodurans]
MKRLNKWMLFLVIMLVGSIMLAACGKDEKTEKKSETNTATESEKQNQQTPPNESTVSDAAPPIKEAENLPAKEKKALLAVLDQHISAFNKKDLSGYMDTVSKNPTSFKYDEEKAYMKNIFDTMNIQIKPENVVIIDYKKTEANIFTQMKTIVSEAGKKKKKIEKVSRQINTFRKEEGKWKLIATYAMETK